MYPFPRLHNPPKPTYHEYDDVVTYARRIMPAFVDPANLRPESVVAGLRGDDWCTAVLGRPFNCHTSITVLEQHILIAADLINVDPPLPGWIVEARRAGDEYRQRREEAVAAVRQRDLDVWAEVAKQVTVDLDVYANTTARPRNGLLDHLGHAVPRVEVYSGTRKVRAHPPGRALCESPTRAKPLSLFYKPEPAGTSVTCTRCLVWASLVRATP